MAVVIALQAAVEHVQNMATDRPIGRQWTTEDAEACADVLSRLAALERERDAEKAKLAETVRALRECEEAARDWQEETIDGDHASMKVCRIVDAVLAAVDGKETTNNA